MLYKHCFIAVLCCLFTMGCGGDPNAPKLGKVAGVVTLDGEPASGLSVIFESENGRVASGRTDEAGRYQLNFSDGSRGAEVGANKVRIETVLEHPPGEGYRDPIPAKYNVESNLQVDVQSGDNTHDFKLELK
jgi:hypothetical protein